MNRPLIQELGRRFARVATNAVVGRPRLWPLFRGPMRLQFDRLAPHWDRMRDPNHLASFERALEEVGAAPARALDLGTGTGVGALAIARRFPEVEVVGIDLSEEMLAHARRNTPPELAGRVSFQVGDASRLAFADGTFDLVGLANMIPFFDELARVTAPGGSIIFGFSVGPETPIWVPPERLRSELAQRGFADFAEFQAGDGTALLASKQSPD